MTERKHVAGVKLPKFNSPEEAGEFWDTHSPEDYPDQFQEVQVRFTYPLVKRGLTVKLSDDTIEQLRVVAQDRGIGPSTLARMWILEHLRAEQEQRARSQAVHP
jgi:hypothetical protein